jgi:hypothetical protein
MVRITAVESSLECQGVVTCLLRWGLAPGIFLFDCRRQGSVKRAANRVICRSKSTLRVIMDERASGRKNSMASEMPSETLD